jgi:hypothetical protein
MEYELGDPNVWVEMAFDYAAQAGLGIRVEYTQDGEEVVYLKSKLTGQWQEYDLMC